MTRGDKPLQGCWQVKPSALSPRGTPKVKSFAGMSLLCASQGMAQGARAVSPEHKAASAPVFLVAVEGTVSARDLCHTPALSAM